MKRQHSVPIQLIQSLIVAPRSKGVDIPLVCNMAGLSDWAALIEAGAPDTRFPLDELGGFLITLWRHMEDESGGFLSEPLKLGTFSMMCNALISAGNLRRGLLRSSRYISLMSDDLKLELEEAGDEARLIFEWQNVVKDDEVFFVTSMFIIWIRLSCWMIDRPILLDRVEFKFSKPSYADEFGLMFPCRHAFSQNRNLFAFNKRMLSMRIKQDPHTLIDFLNHAPQSLLTQFRADDSVTAHVKRLLIDRRKDDSTERDTPFLVISLPSFEEVAEALHSTTHTLRRRLKDEGHSFQEIKDSVRRETALDLLNNSELSVQDIAEQLGFSEAAAFIRAFKKWTGIAPAAYRESRL